MIFHMVKVHDIVGVAYYCGTVCFLSECHVHYCCLLNELCPRKLTVFVKEWKDSVRNFFSFFRNDKGKGTGQFFSGILMLFVQRIVLECDDFVHLILLLCTY